MSGYLTALLSEEGESAVTGFMVGYERENYGLWGKIIPVSGFRPTDSIVLYSALSRRTGELFTEAETQISQQWGKGLHLKQFSLPADGQYSVCYRVCDIYDRYHILSREP